MFNVVSDNQKIGIMMLVIGLGFMVLGVLLFFDTGFLVIGNIVFLCSFPLLVGFPTTLRLFNPIARRDKWRGIVCFLGGVILVLLRHPIVGMVIEIVGMINMFGDFFPQIIGFCRSLPFIGHILSLPVVAGVVNKVAGIQKRSAV